ncbi:MAG: endonuclease III domain-containing protein [Minisyncoccales bacterium]
MIKKDHFKKLYCELRKKYGQPAGQWCLWCQRPKTEKEEEEVIIGAILTQRTNWRNVERAMENLKKQGFASLRNIVRLGKKKIIPLIQPAGFYKTKANYLFNLARFIIETYGSVEKMKKIKVHQLREELLKLKGIGPETADSILLYALAKPIFVIDEYTRRLVKQRRLAKNLTYAYLQKLFEKNLKKDYRLYQDFHALIVIDGKNKK